MSTPRSRDRISVADLPDPRTADNIVYNPSLDELREMARSDERTTEFGSPAYISQARSRNADRTSNAIDDEFTDDDHAYIDAAIAAADERQMICLDRRVGDHDELSFVCRYFVPTAYARIALAWAGLLDPAPDNVDPDFVTVQVPDYEDIAIRILPEDGFTAVLGSDYTGEAKKSFLRLFMYEAKRQGGLGLHAGSKRVELNSSGETVGQLFLGLSATGKTTLTSHGYNMPDPDEAYLAQDDVCALLPSGEVAGSEGNGLYIKTYGLDGSEQPELFEAATAATSVLENVDVDPDGTVDFDSDRYTKNGRAVVRRSELPMAAADINLSDVDQVFFITRNPLMPPVAKLSPSEGAAAFMLGESIQTSAGDPDKAGESIRVVGTNPFIIDSPAGEGNRFKSLISKLDVDCFILNTGTVGGTQNIGVDETVAIVRAITKEAITWEKDPATGMITPADVPGIDINRFDVAEHVDDLDERLSALRQERRDYLSGFSDLDSDIVDAVY